MKHLLFTGLAAAALVLAAVTLGRDSPVRLAENAPSAAAEDVSIHGFGDSDKSCQEWTDGCRTCSRPENGELFCSNMPIACQPVAIGCARRAEPPKPEPPKPD
jgi:hypothetical protein